MDKITSTAIVALVIGAVLGYLVRGLMTPTQTPQPTPQVSEKTTMESSAKPTTNDEKIKNAMSAAPDAISKEASVLDWPEKEGAQMLTLQKGTNDWTCLPDFSVSPGNDPICVDKQALLWFQAYMAKKDPKLSQVGLGYMLQGASDASNTDPFAEKPAAGEDWVSAPAHLMVFPTGKLDQNIYGTDDKSGKPWIMWAGTPYEHLMIPVK